MAYIIIQLSSLGATVMHLPLSVSSEISTHFAPHIEENPQDFVCVYGSSVYSPDKKTSDVDLFMITNKSGKIALDPTIEFIRDLHIRHGRHLDEEVPYYNKIHYSAAEVEEAVQFSGFDVSGASITVPPVRKEKSFLEGPAIKARLLLNGLTTPHVVIGKDFSHYHSARERAGEAVTLLAISLLEREEFDVGILHDTLTTGKDGESGEMYLGYKTEYPLVKEHLQGVLSGAVERLAGQDIIHSTNEGFVIQRDTFDPQNYMINTAPSFTI